MTAAHRGRQPRAGADVDADDRRGADRARPHHRAVAASQGRGHRATALPVHARL